ncbi:LacI family transcriptional regulator [Agromyces atrinae]|uniref:DNA-binding LacI/PurR family transcriptional regulator n=1 Tax=Agromyces atrinae TaxID=592376 RepID=A0A4Q2M7Z3_9MICO|nr:LacI family DNA-binding transcriptional regulator [Agromyces atrinae]MCI2957040.1 LacI family transcriptional regulator [Agromyces atrinae]NYD67603.1 DNA-binding LacI/PurR family transcriptional regulator [Agromyces atrinae]RXZ88189.1 LacI family transcriptional regulator [Agromyces atrinae]
MTDPSSRRRPTIDDVAREAGVSRGTVSRVLNGGHWVSPDALTAVNGAIKKTGYRINPHARSLATSRANSIAFLLTESHERLFEDPNFSVLMRGAAEALAERDMSLVLLMAGSDDEQRRATEFITAGHVDGVLLVSSHRGRQAFMSELVGSRVPAISCGIPLGFERKIGSVSADDAEGARVAVEHLRSLGRSRIATIAGPQDTSGGLTRLQGYRLEMDAGADDSLIAYGDYSRVSGAAAMRELLDRRPDLDAVFIGNDLMAAGALEVLAAAGRRVPEDVAVIGFDDSPVAVTTDPQLTTMRQPFERISHEMVRLLLQVIEGQPAATVTLPTELVVRASA